MEHILTHPMVYITLVARMLMLAYVIALTVTIVGRIVRRDQSIPRVILFKHGLAVSMFIGLMGWLD